MEDLKKMTVEQLLDSEDYRKELEVQIGLEVEHHDRMMREAFVKGLRLQRNPVSRLRERGVMNADDIVAAYKMIIAKCLDGFSATERDYIRRLCMTVYQRVVERYRRNEEHKEST